MNWGNDPMGWELSPSIFREENYDWGGGTKKKTYNQVDKAEDPVPETV